MSTGTRPGGGHPRLTVTGVPSLPRSRPPSARTAVPSGARAQARRVPAHACPRPSAKALSRHGSAATRMGTGTAKTPGRTRVRTPLQGDARGYRHAPPLLCHAHRREHTGGPQPPPRPPSWGCRSATRSVPPRLVPRHPVLPSVTSPSVPKPRSAPVPSPSVLRTGCPTGSVALGGGDLVASVALSPVSPPGHWCAPAWQRRPHSEAIAARGHTGVPMTPRSPSQHPVGHQPSRAHPPQLPHERGVRRRRRT